MIPVRAEDVRDGMAVRITAGDAAHPLHGWAAEVIHISAPLPASPPVDWAGIAGLRTADDGMYRPDDWESPFAFPGGKLLLYLGDKPGRPWAFPYVTVSPCDVEAVK
jgi:hypothetical protein